MYAKMKELREAKKRIRELEDKCRVLSSIIAGTYSTYAIRQDTYNLDPEQPHLKSTRVVFHHSDLKRGDIVMCHTTAFYQHPWVIAEVEEVLTNSDVVLREIGSDNLFRMSNEGFIRILGLDDRLTLTGGKYRFWNKVIKAFRRGHRDHYFYRFHSVEFLSDKRARIWIRAHVWLSRNDGSEVQPFSFEMDFNASTTIKVILAKMIEAGYGTHEWVYKSTKEDTCPKCAGLFAIKEDGGCNCV